jgi:T5SS/PEP-CTERM-associated repeat protein
MKKMRTESIMRTHVTPLLCLAGGALTLVAGLQPAQAEDYSWNTAHTGNFLDSANWTPTGAPNDNQDTAIFGVPGESEVAFGVMWTNPTLINKRLIVNAGTVKFDLVNSIWGQDFGVTYLLDPPQALIKTAARIGETAGPQARLVIAGGDYYLSGGVDARGALFIGYGAGSNGRLDIGNPDWTGRSRGNWTSTHPTWVGLNGTGTLVVRDGEMVDGGATIGGSAGVIGIANILIDPTTWGTSSWTNHGNLIVGQSGIGVLNVESDVITDGDGYIAQHAGSSGNVTVGPPDAYWSTSWTVGGNLYVGGDDQAAGGTGSLTLQNGIPEYSTSAVNVAGEMTVWPSGSISIMDESCSLTCEGRLNMPGGTIEIDGGRLTVLDLVNGSAGCEINLLSGALEAQSFAGYDGNTLNWTSGEVIVSSDGLNVDDGEDLGSNLQVDAGKSLSVAADLRVGPVHNGVLTVIGGGTVTSGMGYVGSIYLDAIAGSASLTGPGSSWTVSDYLKVRAANDAQLSLVNGAALSCGDAYLADLDGTSATVTLVGAGTQWDVAGALFAGGDEQGPRGAGSLEVDGDAALDVAGTVKVFPDFVIEIDGGSMAAHDLDIWGEVWVLGDGALNVQDGAVDIESGGTLNGVLVGDSFTTVQLHGAYANWTSTGSVTVGASNSGSGRVGELVLEPGAHVTVEDTVTVEAISRLILAGGTIDATAIDLLDADFNDFGELNGEFSTTGSVTAAGTLTLGNIDSYSGVQIGGALNVGPHHVTVNTGGAFTLGNATSVAGGTLTAPNGVALPVGNNLVAHGTIAGRVTTQAGSTIEADGDLSLGDPASPIGFVAQGDLVVGASTVTIWDSNGAALGPITWLGPDDPGTLTAANGLTLADEDIVVGQGVIDTPNDPAKPLTNDGAIIGNSAEERIELTGYIKGLGTLDYVTITGTDNVGQVGPAAVSRGNVDYLGNLVIEIGGLFAGTQHDQISHDGTAGLGGELTVQLIAGFEPSPGDSFTILVYTDYTGQFDALSLPELPAGLEWDVVYGASSLMLEAVEEQVPCDGDLDGDGDVDLGDLAQLLGSYGTTNGAAYEDGDLDGDGDVDLADLAALLGFYGTICE